MNFYISKNCKRIMEKRHLQETDDAVITSYSIHYTKLYEELFQWLGLKIQIAQALNFLL